MIQAGDTVKCIKRVDFGDGTSHEVGQIIIVEPRFVNYYNTYTSGSQHHYDLLEPACDEPIIVRMDR